MSTLKTCTECNITYELTSENFYSNGAYKGRVKFKPTCRKCETAKRMARFDELLLSVFGKIECKRCGYDKCKQAIDCHHLDGDLKEYAVGRLRTSGNKSETIINELKKCVLLCSNCHREYHAGLFDL
ncbi:hypothetical protein pEaSNUABM55_00082 [Erwinia phage pEa_SNUABM_55]|nr:hypothetical protein pEaSNUABM55_00082 [Erwinia phage pEa_SNUABM_55]